MWIHHLLSCNIIIIWQLMKKIFLSQITKTENIIAFDLFLTIKVLQICSYCRDASNFNLTLKFSDTLVLIIYQNTKSTNNVYESFRTFIFPHNFQFPITMFQNNTGISSFIR